MGLPFNDKRLRAYELEFGAGGQRLGCNFMLDDGTLLFVNESEITSEIETLMASLGSPSHGLQSGPFDRRQMGDHPLEFATRAAGYSVRIADDA